MVRDNTKFKLRLVVYKRGQMRYFSQLDLVKIFERALRRTQLPIYFTKGFNPHVKMSFSKALKLGMEGEVSIVLYFSEDVSLQEVEKQLLLQLPQDLEILKIENID